MLFFLERLLIVVGQALYGCAGSVTIGGYKEINNVKGIH